jgi:protein-disulfide isomerase
MCAVLPARSEITVSSQQALEVGGNFRDMAVSHNGKWIYVLTEKGDILIYSGSGELKGSINAGSSIDSIRSGPTEEVLIVGNRSDGRVKILNLDLIRDIPISGSPFKGDESAPVVIVVFSEFQCPYCAKIAPALGKVVEKYPDRVKLVFKNYPLRKHRFALSAATAALAAAEQGRFWQFHDLLFANQKQMSEQKIVEIARILGLDMQKFQQARKDSRILNKIREDIKEGRQVMITGTPTIFINGRRLRSLSAEAVNEAVEKELERCADESGQESP